VRLGGGNAVHGSITHHVPQDYGGTKLCMVPTRPQGVGGRAVHGSIHNMSPQDYRVGWAKPSCVVPTRPLVVGEAVHGVLYKTIGGGGGRANL
jgi:hypothetical protein